MNFINNISCLLALAASTSATYQCPVSPSSNDAQAIMFGLSLRNLLTSYYAEVLINASFYSTLPSTMPVTVFLTNTMGIFVQAKLGMQGLQELASAAGASMPSCFYTFPPVTDAESHLVNAYNLEATMCGACIGLADYVHSSQAAFLMARLAAEHGIHASYIQSRFRPVVFFTNSTMLTPAFTPGMVSMTRIAPVGPLCAYLNNCVAPPMVPCDGNITIGKLDAMLIGEGSMNTQMNGTTMSGSSGTSGRSGASGASGSGTSSASPVAFTGAAVGGMQHLSLAAVVTGIAAAMLVRSRWFESE